MTSRYVAIVEHGYRVITDRKATAVARCLIWMMSQGATVETMLTLVYAAAPSARMGWGWELDHEIVGYDRRVGCVPRVAMDLTPRRTPKLAIEDAALRYAVEGEGSSRYREVPRRSECIHAVTIDAGDPRALCLGAWGGYPVAWYVDASMGDGVMHVPDVVAVEQLARDEARDEARMAWSVVASISTQQVMQWER